MDDYGQKMILCCVGTRPEAIKMAPVIRALRRSAWAEVRVLATAQHRKLLDQMLAFFRIRTDIDLDVMQDNQPLAELTARLLVELDKTLAAEVPDLVLAQGDTTSVLTTALACFYRQIPFGHVEAGLRTHNLDYPFPEEANRLLAGQLATLHFAPTTIARDNLLREGVPAHRITVVGNPVIDALMTTRDRDVPLGVELDPRKRLILVTAHRRESFGLPLRRVCRAVREINRRYEGVEFLWPVHPNPSVGPVVRRYLGREPGIHLCEPLPYGSFVTAMLRSYLILTDSGGLQEEAPALGKPVLVLRDESERPEAVTAGASKLIGTNSEKIIAETQRLLDDPQAYKRMSMNHSMYGDGRAAERIVSAIEEFLGLEESKRVGAYVPLRNRISLAVGD